MMTKKQETLTETYIRLGRELTERFNVTSVFKNDTYTFTLSDNEKNQITGFGQTIEDALIDFYLAWANHIAELPEVMMNSHREDSQFLRVIPSSQ